MPQSILELIFKTSKSGTGGKAAAAELKELKSGVGELSSGLLGVNLASVGVIGVITAVGAEMNVATKETVAYASEVRDLSRISGASVEETSRLIQTADDLKVEYSTLEQAAKALAKNGIALTTEELAKASDEYLAIEDAGGRAEYATTKFGKAGLELTKVLEVGGDALKQMAAEQSSSLILSQKQVDAARKLEIAQDALDDSFQGIKYTVGNAVIPVITDFLTLVTDTIFMSDKLSIQLLKSTTNYEDYSKAVVGATQEEIKQNEIIQVLGVLFPQLTLGIAANAVAQNALTEQQYKLKNGMYDIQDEGTRMADAMRNAAAATQELNTASTAASVLMQNYTTQLLYNQAAAGLDADAALTLAYSMGLVDEKTAFAIGRLSDLAQQLKDKKISVDDYTRAVAALNREMNGITDRSATIRITTVNTNVTRNEQRYGGEGYASGGSFTIPPGYENHTWPVGPNKWAESGETVTIKPKSGSKGSSGGNPLVETVIINNGMDQASFERMLMKATRK